MDLEAGSSLEYTSNSSKISNFEGFDHKMLQLPSFINFLHSEIAPFWCGEAQ